MDQLSIYLPPFAGDYSGVCSALYELNSLIIIDDASCCTRNYVTYDEPRWTKNKKAAFGSHLRTIEAVLGDEERLIKQTLEAVRELAPEFVALLGSPIPAIIGRDMAGIAREIEERSGIPALGFNTTGFSYYNKGISDALLKVLQRFTVSRTKKAEGHVNILGLTPLDFSANDNGKNLIRLLEENGFHVACSFWMEADLDRVRRAASAEVNLVVSQSGWAGARYMYEHYGIPYVVASPVGEKYSRTVIEALKRTMKDGKNSNLNKALSDVAGPLSLLIIGDQVISNSLRSAMYQLGCFQNITVASFFALEPELALPGDLFLKSEKQLSELLKSGDYRGMIADPLIGRIPAAVSLECYDLPHPAVSSLLYWNDVPLLIGRKFEESLQNWIGG